jgi:pimeloyl-ACP methyl ester carboxylesterase
MPIFADFHMSDLDAADLEAEAQRLVDELGRPKRRVRPRLARLLNEAEDQEVATPHGGIMAWRLGTGRATLMVHGWEDDNALWSPLIDLNAEMMRGSVAFDLPGHGWSPAEECSIQAAGAAVLAVAEAFGPIDSVVAHSFGCPSTIWAMANGLNVERAVMIASPVPRTETRSQARDMTRWEQAQLHEGVSPEVIARARVLMAERPMMRSSDRDFDIEAVLPTLTAKALILHSMDDEQCPVANSQRMAELWPGSELVLLDNLGHRLIAQEPDVVARVFEFVDAMD